MEKKFKGVYAVVVTPFTEDGKPDCSRAKRHLDWLCDQGMGGVCILGATGEYQSLSNEEHKAYLAEILPYIRGRMSAVVGVSRERPDDVVELMNNAEACGAEAAMFLPPFYCHPNQEEILENDRYGAARTTLPIILYNNPGSAGVDISRETLRAAMELPNIRILKESTGDIHRLTEAVMDAPEHVSVFCGCDNLAMESFVMGACGWICMAANFAPKDCCALLERVEAGDLAGAKDIYRRLLPALNLLESVEKPAATIKYILKKYRGIDMGHMRRPRRDLTPEECARVDAWMDYASVS